MKKIIILLVAIIIILSAALVITNLNNDNNEAENKPELITQSEEVTTENNEELTTQSEEVLTENITESLLFKTDVELKVKKEIDKINIENTDAWKQAYINFLNNNYFSDTEFSKIYLGYIDDNDIPELFVSSGGFHVSSVEIFTFNNNLVSLVCEGGSFGNIGYFERKGYICGDYTGMGCSDSNVYILDNGKIQKIYNAYTNEFLFPQDESFKEEINININGIDVSSEEMNEFSRYYFGENMTLFEYDDQNMGCKFDQAVYTDYINNF